jgi:ankyrin repeat protein
MTPMHYASYGGHADIAQMLLSYNAAVDARTSEYLLYHRIVDENASMNLRWNNSLEFTSDFLYLQQ